MNRYPIWKYAIIMIALVVGVLYTLPNFFGEAPAVQVSSAKVVVKVDSTTLSRVEEALKGAGIAADLITLDGTSIKARFGNTETQLKAKDALQKALHFMLQVDMPAALTKKTESLAGDIRTILREKNVRHSGISRNGQSIEVRFRDAATLASAKALVQDQFTDLQTVDAPDGAEFRLSATIKPEAARRV